MTTESLKEAIAELPEEERHSLATWINGLDYDDWDRELAGDFSPAGRGAYLVEKVKREITSRKARLNAGKKISTALWGLSQSRRYFRAMTKSTVFHLPAANSSTFLRKAALTGLIALQARTVFGVACSYHHL